MKDKVVLAFSGGLDTSYCVKYLKHEKGLEVHTVLINCGGFSKEELEEVSQKALQLGAASHQNIDETQNYYQKAIRYLLFGNILKNNTYPLSVSAERIFQAMAIAECVKSTGARYVAHGSTGAGNDQVRFDMVFQILIPEVEILTPIRDQQLSRQEEIDYLSSHGVTLNWEKAKYSINKGLWGTSVGGAETLTPDQSLPEEAYPVQVEKDGSETVVLHFENGEITGINDESMSPVDAIVKLQEVAAPYGIGRDTHVGDTIIGIKGRVGFEAAAPLILIKSHQLLEKHVLSKWQQHWKDQLGNWYGMLLHEGQYLEPVMRNIEKFLADTQTNVTGEVRVALHPYRFQVLGIRSRFDLMNPAFGNYGEMNTGWTGEDVRGFTKVLANSMKIHHAVNK